jgi:hypothetical protein
MPPKSTSGRSANELEVDYDVNITALYENITNSDWDTAIRSCISSPVEAETWVVRRYEGSNDIMWRFLPIHSACARQPPANVIASLLEAYPDGAGKVDDQGMYPLHYACGNQASREVIRALLVAFPAAAKMTDPRGMLPIHYLACWGPSTVSIIDMVLVAHRDVSHVKDADGNTPLKLALEGEYEERDQVVVALKRWFDKVDTQTDSSASVDGARSVRSVGSGASTSKDGARSVRSAGSSGSAGAKENRTIANTPTVPLTVARLRQEITKLKLDKKQRDSEWEDKMNVSIGSLTNKNAELERQVESATVSLGDAQNRLEELERIVEAKDKRLKSLEKQVQEVTLRLVDVQAERDELRLTLGDISEAHDKYKRKSEIMADRIGSLSASLSGMMDEQENLIRSLQDRDTRLMEESMTRRNQLQDLIDMEDRYVADASVGDGRYIEDVMDRQNKEMDAIAALIASVRS